MVSSYELDRLDRIRRTTAEHAQRRGLYLAAFGLFLGALAFGGVRESPVVAVLPFAVLLAAVTGYYRGTFGTVVPRRGGARFPAWLLVPVLLLGVLLVVTAANVTGAAGHLTGGLIFAALLALIGVPPWPGRAHYPASAVLLMALTLAPLGVLTPSGQHPFASAEPLWQLLTVGALLVVNGLLDHRALVRSLPRRAGEEE
ncbi:hypothetical protein HD597_004204 [Nonomuraea thailandensis]|uniref:Uncharacterized protein n=1 Tax=Nonomuraea thailandensis TaxID=1188745 RepID=A0A9X2GGP8_9ACTN|nr:hypothetical protein [Nonomuraea thailandensis]MCP2357184.1 hypothetical protein [Nonomuraea thailandensis]